jgi:hypothetical protein
MFWIDLAQDGDQWKVLGNTVMTSGFDKMLGSSWVDVQLAIPREGLSSVLLVLWSI